MKRIDIIRSEEWISNDLLEIGDKLDACLEAYVNHNDKLINIEIRESENGNFRFWIFVEKSYRKSFIPYFIKQIIANIKTKKARKSFMIEQNKSC